MIVNLSEFEVRTPADPAKSVQELVHEPCGAVLCDVEPGDNLQTLVAVATDHPCDGHRSGSPYPELRGCLRDGYTSEHVNQVFDRIHADTGTTLVCVWDYHDVFGTGGNAEFYVYIGHGLLREVGGDLLHWLNLDPDDPDSPEQSGDPATWLGPISNDLCLEDPPWWDGQYNYAIRDDR